MVTVFDYDEGHSVLTEYDDRIPVYVCRDLLSLLPTDCRNAKITLTDNIGAWIPEVEVHEDGPTGMEKKHVDVTIDRDMLTFYKGSMSIRWGAASIIGNTASGFDAPDEAYDSACRGYAFASVKERDLMKKYCDEHPVPEILHKAIVETGRRVSKHMGLVFPDHWMVASGTEAPYTGIVMIPEDCIKDVKGAILVDFAKIIRSIAWGLIEFGIPMEEGFNGEYAKKVAGDDAFYASYETETNCLYLDDDGDVAGVAWENVSSLEKSIKEIVRRKGGQ